MGVRKKTHSPATRFLAKIEKVINFEGSLEGSVKTDLEGPGEGRKSRSKGHEDQILRFCENLRKIVAKKV